MKYIVFSFDDGREDFFSNALPILKKYDLKATLNVIPSFIDDKKTSDNAFLSSSNKFVNDKQIREILKYKCEIASHSFDHTNEPNMILKSISYLKKNFHLDHVGFASPNSYICKKNFHKYKFMLDEGLLDYIRSGNQVKRDGILHIGIYLLMNIFHSSKMFYVYNKRNIFKKMPLSFFPSVTINKNTTFNQVKYFIDKMKNNDCCIFMFHSILKNNDNGFDKDKWFNEYNFFESFCSMVRENKEICVLTNLELYNFLKEN